MPFNTNHKIQIVDASGDACDSDSGKLNVNIAGGGFDGAITAADNAIIILGAKSDNKSFATDTTSITMMQVLKQISASVQDTATDTGTIDSDTDAIKTAVEGTLTVDLGSNNYVTVTGDVGHNITGGADGVKTVTSAGTDVVLGLSVSVKKVDIQAQTDNTGLIAVGFTGVDATEATGTGIILRAGDTYSLEISNLNLIYIDSTVSGEGVRYTYFT